MEEQEAKLITVVHVPRPAVPQSSLSLFERVQSAVPSWVNSGIGWMRSRINAEGESAGQLAVVYFGLMSLGLCSAVGIAQAPAFGSREFWTASFIIVVVSQGTVCALTRRILIPAASGLSALIGARILFAAGLRPIDAPFLMVVAFTVMMAVCAFGGSVGEGKDFVAAWRKGGRVAAIVNKFAPPPKPLQEKRPNDWVGQVQSSEAAALIRSLMAANPSQSGFNGRLGIILKEKKFIEAAILAFRAAVAENPLDAGSHLHLGLLLSESADYEGSLAEFENFLRLPINASADHREFARAKVVELKARLKA